MLLVESTLKISWEMDLDFTIQEVTQCMTPIQMSMIHGEQKKEATVQLVIQEFASRVALVMQGGPSPQSIEPCIMI